MNLKRHPHDSTVSTYMQSTHTGAHVKA